MDLKIDSSSQLMQISGTPTCSHSARKEHCRSSSPRNTRRSCGAKKWKPYTESFSSCQQIDHSHSHTRLPFRYTYHADFCLLLWTNKANFSKVLSIGTAQLTTAGNCQECVTVFCNVVKDLWKVQRSFRSVIQQETCRPQSFINPHAESHSHQFQRETSD